MDMFECFIGENTCFKGAYFFVGVLILLASITFALHADRNH